MRLTRSGRNAELPDNILERLEPFIRHGALHVPRAREACDLWVGAVYGTNNPWGRGQHMWITPDDHKHRWKQSVAAIMLRVYEFDSGPIPAGRVVNHTCDVESCVNPAHLYDGPPAWGGSDLHRRGCAVDQGVAWLALAAHLRLHRKGERAWAPWLERAEAQLNTKKAA